MPKNTTSELTVDGVLLDSALYAGAGALGGGVFGWLGNNALSFFNPNLASTVGGFATFAALGAIAYPLTILPKLLINHFANKSSFLNNHPNFKGFILDTADALLVLGAVTASALLLGTPLAASVISMMVIPAAIYVLSTLCRAINAILSATTPVVEPDSLAATVHSM